MTGPRQPSVWLFDIGNSRLKFARLDDAGQLQSTSVLAHAGGSAAELATLLPAGDVAHVANVAPVSISAPILQALGTRFVQVQQVRTLARIGRLQIAYPHPQRLGVDRFLSLLGVQAQIHDDVLLVGVGTALTIDLLQADGRHHGGLIAPSPTTMRDMLHARVPQLPAQGGRLTAFANDTADALASGCDGAALALIERSLQAAAARLGHRPQLIVHGGGTDALLAYLPEARHLPSLVLQGLAHWVRLGAGAPVGEP